MHPDQWLQRRPAECHVLPLFLGGWRSKGCLNFGVAGAAHTTYLDTTTPPSIAVPRCHTAVSGTTTITIAAATTTTAAAPTCIAVGRLPRVQCLDNRHAPQLGCPRRLDRRRCINHLRLEGSIGVYKVGVGSYLIRWWHKKRRPRSMGPLPGLSILPPLRRSVNTQTLQAKGGPR